MADSAQPIRWNPWPASIIAFFSVAVVGCGVFIAFCNRHPADLIAPDYYEQEVRYQGELERLQNAQRHASTASVTYNPDRRQITVALPPSHALAGASGNIRLYRPSALNLDREMRLALSSNGSQIIDAADLKPGLWKVRVAWTAEKQEYLIDRPITIGAGPQLSAR